MYQSMSYTGTAQHNEAWQWRIVRCISYQVGFRYVNR